ncbi:MAG: hypothetical protein QM778_05350 [Myxococcales bacterium]
MSSAGTDLRRAVEAFRRGQGVAYLEQLGGAAVERVPGRRWLGSEQGLARFEEARQGGELSDAEAAALAAHVGRAVLELHYERARRAALELSGRSVSYEGETRRVGLLLGQWVHGRGPAQRHALARSLDREFQDHARVLLSARHEADGEAGDVLRRMSAGRHPDAGPEAGNVATAERWLTLTEDLAQESFAFARREFRVEGEDGLETLWSLLGSPLSGLFPRPGRLRRLAAEWEPLGLRRLLRAHVRAAAEHPGLFPGAHVVPLAAPHDIRLSPTSLEFGLASELATADALARAMAQAHASRALPLPLRHAAVGSVARALGQLGVLLFADPLFLRKVRGMSARESQIVARLATAYALLDSRLSAAAVLARGIANGQDLERASAHAARALTGTLPTGWGALLVLRVSPGGPLRAKSLAPGLAYCLRERFDADWFLNPRAADPIRGALARAGEFAVEQWAEELGATLEQGPGRLAELF